MPTALSILALLTLCAPQEAQPPRADRFPLGLLGGVATVTVGTSAATVVELDAGAPGAVAGLAVGDRILGVGGVAFAAYSDRIDAGGDGPQRALGEALDAAGEAEPRRVVLQVRRGPDDADCDVEVTVALPERSSLAGPHAREARLALRRAAAAQLLAAQRSNGMWDSPVGLTGDRVLTAWALVALLAHGDDAHRDAIDRAATWLHGPDRSAWLPEDLGRGPDGLGNWALTATAIALAEHWHLDADADDAAVVDRCCRALVARMSEDGRFGHDVTVGYAGKGFNVINAQAQLAWAMAMGIGVEVDERAWTLSLDQLAASIDPDGGVRYWTMRGTGTGDASLRTSATALALALTGQRPELHGTLMSYLDAHAARVREAHAVGSLGMLLQAPALRAWDGAAYQRFLAEWRWYLALTRGPDDRLRYIGGKRNNGGDSYLGFDLVACVIALQVAAQEDARLWMVDRGGGRREL
ncbi:MAG: hypothetical protein IPM29_03665 [Planctomycetes bacterium]|nr:hypothetical protein [Planctomycetota bacterium]